MDEAFGCENFVSQITYTKTAGTTGDLLPGTADFLLWYSKNRSEVKYRSLMIEKVPGGQGAAKYTSIELPDGTRRPRGRDDVPAGARAFRLDNLTSQSQGREKGVGASSWFEVELEGRKFTPTMQSRWKTNEEGMTRLRAAGRLAASRNTLNYVRYIDDFPAFPITNTWTDIGGIQSRADPKVYVVQTATAAVQRCMLMTTDPGDLVIDPTCGAGTTAYVAEQWGRRWITIDTSRVALALARTRLMCARFPYYLLADSADGSAKEATLTGQPAASGGHGDDVRRGFVYKRVPHITLKSIAQNPDISEGMSRDEIDAVIARHADSELLVDQPYEDRMKVRVTGRFTVESLSPHRVLDDDRPPRAEAEASTADDVDGLSFEQTILDNLRKAGVHNTFRGEDIRFDRLDPYAGTWIQAEGEFTDADGDTRRVAIAIGPEHGTVGPDQIREAAKEATRGAGFDLLVLLGFAFDRTWADRA